MSFFGFSSKKEVAEKEKQAREELLKQQQTDLANLAKGSQVNFSIPYFDVFDPRFENFAVPVAVHGSLVYAVNDINRFNEMNKTQNINDGVFAAKLKDQVAMYVKGVVTNAPSDNMIQVMQIERKILEISGLVQQLVTPKIEANFGINVRSIDISQIVIDKTSRGYRELISVTSDLEKDRIQTSSRLNLDAMKRQQEMTLGGQEELQRMQLENQRETMRIQREEMQRAARLQTETNFLGAHQADLNANVAQTQAMFGARPTMPSMGMPQMQTPGSLPQMPGMPPMVQYMVGINGQPMGPYDWTQLQALVKQGQLTQQSQVWKQGMPQWAMAGQVQELQPLFGGQAPAMGGMPGMPMI